MQAAAALSRVLRALEVPHAFYGNVWTAVLSNAPHSDVRPSYSANLLSLIYRRKFCASLKAGQLTRSVEFVKPVRAVTTSLL